MELVTLDAIRDARRRLEGITMTTPVERSRAIGELIGGDVWLKCENLQRTGSFKLRGAYNRIARLSERERANGVVCASAGNHAQGVALAAALQGVRATVVMPREAPLPKVDATQAYGAEVRLEGDTFDEALQTALGDAHAHGQVFVHPFDHPDIIAGQGTIGLEILDQVPDVGTVVVCLGGGGLLSGIAVALRALRPDIRIVGVQASGSASFPASLEAGEPLTLPTCDTIADGIAVKRPGELTLAHVKALVDEVVTVDDEEIARAVVLLLERAKLVVEPAGAAAVAALLAGRIEVTRDHATVATLSGGNIDPLMLQHLVTGGLTTEGRYVTLRTQVPDTPGQLSRLLRLVGDQRANVVGVSHHRLENRLRLGQVEVVLELETRGHDHVARLQAALEEAGYPLHRP
ncbi:MAG TPA: threonine ammonia-lyase [Egicoccus sp.]|nr:threonine ammonia-lyase [Egicoccus sp.]HSK22287.1 threonine ammonia-lyase [Egicoccus sp.]